jgi:hypothetical protein
VKNIEGLVHRAITRAKAFSEAAAKAEREKNRSNRFRPARPIRSAKAGSSINSANARAKAWGLRGETK